MSILQIIGVAFTILLFALIVAITVKTRYRIAKPDEAIIVTGRKSKELVGPDGQLSGDISSQRVVTGGGVFVKPLVQKAYRLPLRSRKLTLTTEAQTTDGITINAQAVAVVKVGGTQAMIRSAAQRFLSNPDEIDDSTTEVLSGSLRSIIGGLTVTDIIRDRAAVATSVLDAVEEVLTKQGLVIDTLQIQEISDAHNYIRDLGRPESARVSQEAQIAETRATQAAEEARIQAETRVLEQQREYDLRRAAVQVETDRARAVAEASKPLEDATQRQAIVTQEELTAQREVGLKKARLESEVREAADAEAYRIEALARAEAAKRKAEAEAALAEGEAEARVIEARGRAEATAIDARADALDKQAAAVLAQELIARLPEMVAASAQAVAAIDQLTVVSADGAHRVAGDSLGSLKGVIEMSKSTLGIDIPAMLSGALSGHVAGGAAGNAIGDALHEGAGTDRRPESKPAAEGAHAAQTTAGSAPAPAPTPSSPVTAPAAPAAVASPPSPAATAAGAPAATTPATTPPPAAPSTPPAAAAPAVATPPPAAPGAPARQTAPPAGQPESFAQRAESLGQSASALIGDVRRAVRRGSD